MKQNISLPTYYFGHVISVLKSLGVQVDSWLASEGLDLGHLIALDARVSVEQFDALMQKIIEANGFYDFGIRVGKRLEIAHHGDFGLAVLNCANLTQVLDFHRRFLGIRVPFVSVDYTLANKTVVLTLNDEHWRGSLHRSIIEAVMIAIVNMLHSLDFQDGSELIVEDACFDYPAPEYQVKYQAMKAQTLRFDQEVSCITFSSAYLSKALNNVDEFSFQRAIARCESELALYQQQNLSTKDRVLRLLKEEEGCHLSLEEVAARLFMSKRTLHRHLDMESYSFKDLLQGARAEQSKRLLSNAYSVAQTAEYLGYSDSANFRRAFKSWFGIAPKQWVKQHSQKGK
jgi:AraC-like DNA-binding protein